MAYQTHSAKQTQQLAAKLAQQFKNGGIIALEGPLGAGKTTFVQGFAQGLGIQDKLTSPTFIIMRQYEIPHYPQGKLFHLDLYRLNNISQITDLGIKEIFDNPHNIILIEWAEKLGSLKPNSAKQITLTILGETKRQIEVV